MKRAQCHIDALVALGSACSEIGGNWIVIVCDIPTPSFEPGEEDVMWISIGLSWIDP